MESKFLYLYGWVFTPKIHALLFTSVFRSEMTTSGLPHRVVLELQFFVKNSHTLGKHRNSLHI